MEQFAFGWLPQPLDDRDRQFKLATAPKQLPAKVDLSAQCGPVLNQGAIGSCTAHAIAVAVWQAKVRASKTPFIPSRLFVYYHERVAINQVNEDSGAYLRESHRVFARLRLVKVVPLWVIFIFSLFKTCTYGQPRTTHKSN